MTEDELLALATILRNHGIEVRLYLALAVPHADFSLVINDAGVEGVAEINPLRRTAP